MIWRLPPRSELPAIALAVAIAAVLLAYVAFPDLSLRWQAHWGFGPDWQCSYAGQGDPVCVKQPKKISSPREGDSQGGG